MRQERKNKFRYEKNRLYKLFNNILSPLHNCTCFQFHKILQVKIQNHRLEFEYLEPLIDRINNFYIKIVKNIKKTESNSNRTVIN